MRKTSYVVAFFAVAFTLTLNIISAQRPDWLTIRSTILGAQVKVRYGLYERCEQVIISTGSTSVNESAVVTGGRIEYEDYKCRPFPTRQDDRCEKENKHFCMAWTTAGYFTTLSAGFAGVACLSIIFGVSTHSRRRRIWRAVAAFVFLHAAFQVTTFAIVTKMYDEATYPSFEYARPGLAYVLHTVSWILALIAMVGVVITGISANRGHRWAAGNRAYQPISG